MTDARAVEFVEARSGGVCEACGAARASEVHHRKYRSRGGTDDVWNLLHLCGWGNHTGCHGLAHSKDGHALGLSVNSWADPREVPAVVRGVLVHLTGDAENPYQ